MKRRTILCSLIVFIAFSMLFLMSQAHPAHADSATYQIMTTQGTTGAGTAKQYPALYEKWACQFNITGAPSETVVKIEGNLAGSTYTRLATWTQSTDTDYSGGQGMINFTSKAAKKLRANVQTLTSGTNPTVTVICAGMD